MLKVLQLIDSLDAGGAERVAVNIANELALKGHASHLCVTRREGLLKSQINSRVFYHFLDKKGTIDLKAIKNLSQLVQDYNIGIIHAHSTSFFLASLMKIRNPKLKIVWHDHYGNAEALNQRSSLMLKICSRFFNQVIAVNKELKNWSSETLGIKKVQYLRNFAIIDKESVLQSELPGKDGKRIVHLANFRAQKDHLNLLKAFKLLHEEYKDWSLLLVGKSFDDDYFTSVVNFIKDKNLTDSVFILGSRMDAHVILGSCDIGVLSSQSEGLPLALIEYGLSGLPVVATNVGACQEVLDEHGSIVPAMDSNALCLALKQLMDDATARQNKAIQLQTHVEKNYGAVNYIQQLELIYDQL